MGSRIRLMIAPRWNLAVIGARSDDQALKSCCDTRCSIWLPVSTFEILLWQVLDLTIKLCTYLIDWIPDISIHSLIYSLPRIRHNRGTWHLVVFFSNHSQSSQNSQNRLLPASRYTVYVPEILFIQKSWVEYRYDLFEGRSKQENKFAPLGCCSYPVCSRISKRQQEAER